MRLEKIGQERSPNPMWNLTKALRNKKTKTPPLLQENKHVITDEEKAEVLAYSIELQCTPKPASDEEHEQEIKENITEALRRHTEDIRPADYKEHNQQHNQKIEKPKSTRTRRSYKSNT